MKKSRLSPAAPRTPRSSTRAPRKVRVSVETAAGHRWVGTVSPRLFCPCRPDRERHGPPGAPRPASPAGPCQPGGPPTSWRRPEPGETRRTEPDPGRNPEKNLSNVSVSSWNKRVPSRVPAGSTCPRCPSPCPAGSRSFRTSTASWRARSPTARGGEFEPKQNPRNQNSPAPDRFVHGTFRDSCWTKRSEREEPVL